MELFLPGTATPLKLQVNPIKLVWVQPENLYNCLCYEHNFRCSSLTKIFLEAEVYGRVYEVYDRAKDI